MAMTQPDTQFRYVALTSGYAFICSSCKKGHGANLSRSRPLPRRRATITGRITKIWPGESRGTQRRARNNRPSAPSRAAAVGFCSIPGPFKQTAPLPPKPKSILKSKPMIIGSWSSLAGHKWFLFSRAFQNSTTPMNSKLPSTNRICPTASFRKDHPFGQSREKSRVRDLVHFECVSIFIARRYASGGGGVFGGARRTAYEASPTVTRYWPWSPFWCFF